MERLQIEFFSKDKQNKNIITLFRNKEQSLKIFFKGSQDLYFTLNNFKKNNTFIIGKDNYQVWSAFDKLYKDIINTNVYKINVQKEFEEIMTMEGVDESCWHLYQDLYGKLLFEEQQAIYRNYNLKESRMYNDLVINGKIIWKSDDFPIDESPYFIIEPVGSSYLITFEMPKTIRKFILDRESNFNKISVRLSNSNSRYDPFNLLFMNLFNTLVEYLTENEYHQIHIEEYLIEKELESGKSLKKVLIEKKEN